MESLIKLRKHIGLSQRALAAKAGLSYKTLQLLEAGDHDPKVSTLQRIADVSGYPRGSVIRRIEQLWTLPEDSVAILSEKIIHERRDSWKILLFNFVDAFRVRPDRNVLIQYPPEEKTPGQWKALLASVVETLCSELGMKSPDWCESIVPLPKPWFLSGVENLKTSALMESPAHFRKRNIFVLENFLTRR